MRNRIDDRAGGASLISANVPAAAEPFEILIDHGGTPTEPRTMVEPGLQLVACGSSSSSMPTFGSWEQTVLRETYDFVEYISCHAYYGNDDGDTASFLGSAVNMDRFIDAVVATADAVGAELKRKKKIDISFDEWNVWYGERSRRTDKAGDQWEVAPRRIEDEYNVTDAVVVGTR